MNGFTNIPDNTGSVNFSTTTVGIDLERTFSISNTVTAALTLGTVTVPSGFTVVTQPAAKVAAGGSTTIVLHLPTSIAGSFERELSITTNDTDENPYNFTISGAINPANVIEVLVGNQGIGVTGNGQAIRQPQGLNRGQFTWWGYSRISTQTL